MFFRVPVFEAAQAVARSLYPAYGQSWTPPNAADPVAVAQARAMQREQERMFRDACNRLYDGIRSGAVRLLMKDPNGGWVQAGYEIVQCSNPPLQVSIGRIIAEDYTNKHHPKINPYNDWELFIEQTELISFIREIGISNAFFSTDSNARDAKNGGIKAAAFRWFDEHAASYDESVRGQKSRMYADCASALGIKDASVRTYASEWRREKKVVSKCNR